MPSELPGYLFGLLEVRSRTYLLALGLVELPFALGTAVLGETFFRRESGWLFVVAGVGISTSLLAVFVLQRRLAV